jgi:hypothetical protein
VIIDTSERKTNVLRDMWCEKHRMLAKQVIFIDKSLKCLAGDRHELCDLIGNNQLFQLKWGTDLYASLNQKEIESKLNPNPNYHLNAQMIRMNNYMNLNEGLFVGHLFCADDHNFVMTLELFKRATSICQAAGIWIHHRNGLLHAFEAIMQLIIHPLKLNDLFSKNQKLVNYHGKHIGTN